MDTKVTPASKFKAQKRGPKHSSYDPVIEDLQKLDAGYMLTMPVKKGDDANAMRARVQTAIRTGLKKRGLADRVKFSCHVAEDGKSIGIERTTPKPKKRPAKKKTKKKARR